MLFNQPVTPPVFEPVIAIIRPAKEKPKPKKLTLEEKIKTNYYKCNTDLEWIRADNAKCKPKSQLVAKNAPQPIKNSSNVDFTNTYSYGYCTWYVASQRAVPNSWGDAWGWYSAAQRAGWITSTSPQVGDIAWAKGYGHVALVVGVSGSVVTVREANYNGWNVISGRSAPVGEFYYIR